LLVAERRAKLLGEQTVTLHRRAPERDPHLLAQRLRPADPFGGEFGEVVQNGELGEDLQDVGPGKDDAGRVEQGDQAPDRCARPLEVVPFPRRRRSPRTRRCSR
jgi:hypothetical protein